MKNLKFKAVSALLLLSLSVINASAQQRPMQHRSSRSQGAVKAEKIAEIATDELDQVLELTDDQESTIFAANLRYAKERQANGEERMAKVEPGKQTGAERPNREEMQAKMEAAESQRKAHMLEVIQVLTDEQIVDYVCHLTRKANDREKVSKPRPGSKSQGPQGPQARRGAQPAPKTPIQNKE